MIEHRAGILIFLSSMIAIGCAAAGPTLIPVADPTQRIEFQGFSILPPPGERWFISSSQASSSLGIVFMKNYRERTTQPTIVAQAGSATLRDDVAINDQVELLKRIVGSKERELSTGRHRLVEFKTAPDNSLGADCLRYDGSAEDRGVPQFKESIFLLTVHGLYCLHPDSPRFVIALEYSQRVLEGERPLSIEAEGEPFLKSLIFKKLEKPVSR